MEVDIVPAGYNRPQLEQLSFPKQGCLGLIKKTHKSRRNFKMRINNNVMALNAHRNLSNNQGSISKAMEKLSSGLRVNRAADDAAGLAISEKMRAQIRGYNQSVRNAQDGISLIQTAEGAMTAMSDMLVRVKELATQAANGTYTQTDRTKLQNEVTELATAMDNIITNTKFNGRSLLNATGTSITLQVGQEQGQVVSLSGGKFDLQAVQGYVAGLNISDVSGTAAQAVLAAAGGIEDQIDAVSTARAYLGANQNALEYAISNLSTTAENLQAAESRIRDTDMAKEMMNFTRGNILNQAATAMLAQANQLPQSVLQLLG